MSELPDRDDYEEFDNDTELTVLRAWRDGDLKTRDEMDIEAAEVPAIDTFAMFAAEMLGISHEAAMQRADVQEAGALVAKATLDAAWEVADDR